LNRKAFVVAGIFLAIALAAPPYAFITQSDADLDNIINQSPNLSDVTQAQGFVADMDVSHRTLFAIVLAIEVVCVILFVVFLWIGLRP